MKNINARINAIKKLIACELYLAVSNLSVVMCERRKHVKQRGTLGVRVSSVVSEVDVVWECTMHIYST